MDQTLVKIRECASLLLTVDEIAFVCGIDGSKLRNQIRVRKGEMYVAYMTGKLETKTAIRKQIIDFAKAGSPQAETMLNDFMEEQEADE